MKKLDVNDTLYRETVGYVIGDSENLFLEVEGKGNLNNIDCPPVGFGTNAIVLIMIGIVILLWTRIVDFMAMNVTERKGCNLWEIERVKIKSSIWSILLLILIAGQIDSIVEVISMSKTPIPSILISLGIAIIAIIPRGILYFNVIKTLTEKIDDSNCDEDKKQGFSQEEDIIVE